MSLSVELISVLVLWNVRVHVYVKFWGVFVDNSSFLFIPEVLDFNGNAA